MPRHSSCDRLQRPRKEDHPLRHLAVHTPQLRPPESNIEVDVSTNKCVAARAKHGLLRFKQGQGACSMHDQATRSAFQISFGRQLIVARPSPPSWAAGQNEASPPHWLHHPSACNPACMSGPPARPLSKSAHGQQGLETRQTAVRGISYWASASLS